MKKILAALFMLLSVQTFSQVAQYRAINGILIINATKDGQAYRYTNKNILVNMNYQDGSFLLKLNNTDFYQSDSATNANIQDTITQEQYVFSGILPLNQILDQQTNEQNYDIELQLTNENLNLYQTLNLTMTITVPNASGQKNYRIFVINGILQNDELQLPAFSGFDNDIEMWIQFSGIATSN
ncbi:MAG TPA: hypothetical protein VIN10_11075 [Bacteroidales bacterium]